jgi:hypothetical protein
MRDPRTDPRDGDELRQRGGGLRILVDKADHMEVAYRVADALDGLVAAYRVPLEMWRRLATVECEENDGDDD